ncbi:2-amino-4-hydroxy-6-hydroxymethyldihydropteridine diphosphokinase [Sphingomonas crusticola]|uniref:2-amino-4-hydroxy-6- hydroxymethyldihydropteridine diphosphokinase n=1 Tax=Sphingomonas crusticola TaxID=1697973 RepID=UPI000E26BFF8|nr:2-amino-4-hydroxy-6-hydroxymethyldihydropteridine diphosphokinase [Sphingomonas crusticola]
MTYTYAIGLGSNRRHGRHGAPSGVIEAALAELQPVARSRICSTAPLGPSHRRFANAAALIATPLPPPALLAWLKQIEREFGRRRGRRWGARVLDLDILLWSGGPWSGRGLAIPHPHLIERRFTLDPLSEIAPNWRIYGAGTVRQHAARLTRPRPAHRSGRRSGP